MNDEEYDNAYAEGYSDGQNDMETKMEEKIEELKSNFLNALKAIDILLTMQKVKYEQGKRNSILL